MNKKELINVVTEMTGATKKDTGVFIDAFVEAVIESVKSGEDVTITGFGKFTVTERAERNGVNPQTGEAMTIAASKSPKFKAGKNFKDAVNA